MPEKPIEEVIREHTAALTSIPGVAGMGQGECEGHPCIKLFLSKKTPELLERLPASLEGYAVVVVETGDFRALGDR